MAEWEKKSIPLKDGHGWEARPGYSVFVADRGAVRFDFPQDWIIIPDEKGSIKFHDKHPPDDDCTLQMSVFYLNPEVDWSGLPLGSLVSKLMDEDSRFVLERGELVEFRRGRMEVAWAEIRFMDPNEARPAYSRTCLARCRNIQPLLTFDYWENDAARVRPVWDAVMATLRLGETISDPAAGPSRRERRRDRRDKGKGKGKGRKS